jgi:dihydropteroate synthase
MGVLNVTPDSFSDGGQLATPDAVLNYASELLSCGADILDLGGESTRPGAEPVSAAEELARVLPALAALRAAFPAAPISIDTYKPAVATAAIRAGADIINDVWGATHGLTSALRAAALAHIAAQSSTPAPLQSFNASTSPPGSPLPPSPMALAAAELGAPLILMHNRPDAAYADFWPDLLADLRLSLALARAAGVPAHQLWVDPGFGFAKSPAQNLEVVKNLSRVAALGYPVLLGTSRKSTLGRVLGGAPAHDRLEATAATVTWGIQQGAAMVRLHDLPAHQRTLKMADALKAGLAWTDDSA